MKILLFLLTGFCSLVSAGVPLPAPYSIAELKRNGYVKINEPYAKTLLEFDKYNVVKNENDKYACDISMSKCINYDVMVPEGFNKDRGWTGYKLYFEYECLLCSFTFWDLSLSGGYGSLEKRFYMASGDTKGMLYTLSWGDERYIKDLQCATHAFDNSVRGKLNEIADKLESCEK